MNIGYLSTIYHTSFILKSPDNKFLDSIGVDLNWTLFPTGPAMMEAFKSGEIDIGYIGLPPVMIGIDKGLKLKCVAGGHVEGTVMIANDSFSSFHDLGSVSEVLKQFEAVDLSGYNVLSQEEEGDMAVIRTDTSVSDKNTLESLFKTYQGRADGFFMTWNFFSYF